MQQQQQQHDDSYCCCWLGKQGNILIASLCFQLLAPRLLVINYKGSPVQLGGQANGEKSACNDADDVVGGATGG